MSSSTSSTQALVTTSSSSSSSSIHQSELFDLDYDHFQSSNKTFQVKSYQDFFQNPHVLSYLSDMKWDSQDVTGGLCLMYFYQGPIIKWIETCQVSELIQHFKQVTFEKLQVILKLTYQAWVDCSAFAKLKEVFVDSQYGFSTDEQTGVRKWNREEIDTIIQLISDTLTKHPEIWNTVIKKDPKALFTSNLGICWFDPSHFKNGESEPTSVEEWYAWASETDQECSQGLLFKRLLNEIHVLCARINIIKSDERILHPIVISAQKCVEYIRLTLKAKQKIEISKLKDIYAQHFQTFNCSDQDKKAAMYLIQDLMQSSYLLFKDKIIEALQSIPGPLLELISSGLKTHKQVDFDVKTFMSQLVRSIDGLERFFAKFDFVGLTNSVSDDPDSKEYVRNLLKKEGQHLIPESLMAFPAIKEKLSES